MRGMRALLVAAVLLIACASSREPGPVPPAAATPDAVAKVPEADPRPRPYALPALPPPPAERAATDDERIPPDAPAGEELPVPKPPPRPPLAKAEPPLPEPAGPERLLYCERRSERCWACATLDLARERPCDRHTCESGLCVVTGSNARCVPAERRCCPDVRCERAPGFAGCVPTCGDPDGDGVLDRCLLPDHCPEQEVFRTDVIRSYAIARPPSWFRALCGPLPELAQRPPPAPAGTTPETSCGPTPLLWTIPAEQMSTGASDPSGPGLCYGVVSGGSNRSNQMRCGTYHCETLRYCDGREREKYCTVIWKCVDGVPRAVGLTW